MVQEFRYSARILAKKPGFTLVALLTLALGIGANTAIFTVVDLVLVRPLPYPDSHLLFVLTESDESDTAPVSGYSPVAYPNYLDWRTQNSVFESLSIIFPWHGALTGLGPAERVSISFASADFFKTLRVQPVAGRDFVSDDDRPGAPRVAIASHAFCQTRFGDARAAVGKKITIDRASYEIIGVLPAGFHHYQVGEITAPIAGVLGFFALEDRANHNNSYVTGRLKTGISADRARTEMTAIMGRLKLQYPGIVRSGGVALLPLREVLAGQHRTQLLVLLSSVAMVLLIACANVASLFLSDSSVRKKEFAVRAALGASRLALVRLVMAQACLIALGAVIMGVLLAEVSLDFLVLLLPSGFGSADLTINGGVLLFTFGISILAMLLSALFPALHTDTSLEPALKAGSGRVAGSRFYSRLRGLLAISEITIAVVVLIGAGLLAQSLRHLLTVEPGFEPEHVLTLEADWTDSNGITEFYSSVEERLQALPGARAAGAIWPLPLGGASTSIPFYRPHQANLSTFPRAAYHCATPGCFAALGIPLKKGRIFSEADGRFSTSGTGEEVERRWRSQTFKAVVNESMARRYWPDEDPIGKRFRFGMPEFNGPWVEIVGVVGDIRNLSLEQPAQPTFYVSALQNPNSLTFVLRTSQAPESSAQAATRAVHEIDPTVPVSSVRTMEQVINASVSGRRAAVPVLAGFAVLGLLLSAAGIYGLVSYSVAQQTYEIGIRIALGASSVNVLSAFLKQAGRLTLFGLAFGIGAALLLTRLLKSLLFGVEAADLPTFLAVAGLLISVMFVATLVPARRAARVNPMTALRSQ
jgi:putative ABC transport system permease protein